MSSNREMELLERELASLRLPHKQLNQYRQFERRIRSLATVSGVEVSSSKIDALQTALDNAVLCGVSQCFLCASSNNSDSSAMKAAASPMFNRSVSASSAVRHHPPVKTSGYLFSSQVSWHGTVGGGGGISGGVNCDSPQRISSATPTCGVGRGGSTGSASPQPDSIDSEYSGNSAMTTTADMAPVPEENLTETPPTTSEQQEQERPLTPSESLISECEIPESRPKTPTVCSSLSTTPSMTERSKSPALSPSPSPSLSPTPPSPSVSPKPMNSLEHHQQQQQQQRSRSPGPPVSPKPARKTVMSAPMPASLGAPNKGNSYKAYQDFIATYKSSK